MKSLINLIDTDSDVKKKIIDANLNDIKVFFFDTFNLADTDLNCNKRIMNADFT